MVRQAKFLAIPIILGLVLGVHTVNGSERKPIDGFGDLTGFERLNPIPAEWVIATMRDKIAEDAFAIMAITDMKHQRPLLGKLGAINNMIRAGNTRGAEQKIRHDLMRKVDKWFVAEARGFISDLWQLALYMIEHPEHEYWGRVEVRAADPGDDRRILYYCTTTTIREHTPDCQVWEETVSQHLERVR